MDPHATGDGAVMLDIGGDIGAVVVVLPEELLGREIEIVPADGRDASDGPVGGFHAGEHHPEGAPPHVGIVPRRMGPDLVATAVFSDLSTGRYSLSLVPPHHHHGDDDAHTHDGAPDAAHSHDDAHTHDDDAHGHDHPHAHAGEATAPTGADAVTLEVDVVGGEVTEVRWPQA